MLPDLTVPASLAVLVEAFRSCFTAPTFAVFRLLLVGLIGATGRRTVCGMLLGAAVSGLTHHRFHRFFSMARWSADQVGLTLVDLIVERFVPAGTPITVVVDDTLFRRRGKRVHQAFWTHDASQPGRVFARGNRWIIAGVVVMVPVLSRPVCLPVLFRLWAGKGTATPVELARELVGLLARALPDRVIHVAADAAYHGPALRDLPAAVTWTTRVCKNSVFYQPVAPPRPGRRGRPPLKGPRLGTWAQATEHATWTTGAVTRYGRADNIAITELPCLWYGAFGPRAGRLILARDHNATIALFTTDTTTNPAQIISRYAARWSVEVAIENAKGPMGVGQARNRTPLAVARTIPFSMITLSLVTIWYTLYGHHPNDLTDRREREPWYTTKTEPSYQDMLTKLRRTIIAARFIPQRPRPATQQEIHAVHQAWQSAAA